MGIVNHDYGYGACGCEPNYATRGHVNGLAVPALVTGGVALLGQLCNGNGLFGNGLFGGGCGGGAGVAAATALAGQNEIGRLREQVATLTAEKYSDNSDTTLYKQTLADNKTLRDEMFAYVTPIAQEAAANRERVAILEAQQKCDAEKFALQLQLTQKDIALAKAELRGEITSVADNANCCCKQLTTAIAGLQATVGSITKTVIPNTSICPGWGNVTITPSTTTAAA